MTELREKIQEEDQRRSEMKLVKLVSDDFGSHG